MIRHSHAICIINAACFVCSGALIATAQDNPRAARQPRSVTRGLFDLDLDVRDGGVGIQVGPIQVRVGDETKPRPQTMAWLFRQQEVINTPVFDDEGKELGHVEEFIVDVRNGNIRYAAVEFTTLSGREKLYAVPWNSLTLYRSKAGTYFRVDVPADKLRRAPGFDRDKWPSIGNRKWAEAVDVYYGVVVKPGDLKTDFGTDVKSVSKVPYLMRSRNIIGMQVVNLSGKKLGTVADLLIDFSTRRVEYGILKLDGIGLADKRFPVRFSALDLQTGKKRAADDRFALHIEHALLGRAPFFNKETWPNIRDPRWSAEIDRYYGENQKLPQPRVKP